MPVAEAKLKIRVVVERQRSRRHPESEVDRSGRVGSATVTWQSTCTQSTPNDTLATTSFNNVIGFDYALDKDETRVLLAGVQDARVETAARKDPSERHLLCRRLPVGVETGLYADAVNSALSGAQ
jgi:hypothetical protein